MTIIYNFFRKQSTLKRNYIVNLCAEYHIDCQTARPFFQSIAFVEFCSQFMKEAWQFWRLTILIKISETGYLMVIAERRQEK